MANEVQIPDDPELNKEEKAQRSINIPPAMAIEATLDIMKTNSISTKENREAQIKELHEALGEGNLGAFTEGRSFEDGYNLGLEVMRVMFLSKPELIKDKL